MRFTALLILAVMLGCGGQSFEKETYAPDEIYYFEVTCYNPGPNCQEVKRVLDESIPRYKYTFTESSAKKWPYYKAFALDEKVLMDSLVPPHRQLHRLVPRSERPMIGGGDHIIMIDLFSISDTLPDYNVTVYHVGPSGPVRSGTSDLHEVHPVPGDTLSISQTILKSVIRYSFK